AASAEVSIGFADTSPVGGVGAGVMGYYTAGGSIVLVNGWNWYFGSDPNGIAPGQYDFQTVLTHEIGHALGLGESTDPSSAMYLYLSPGTTNRALTATDLNNIALEVPAGFAPIPAVGTPWQGGQAPGVSDPEQAASLAQTQAVSPVEQAQAPAVNAATEPE